MVFLFPSWIFHMHFLHLIYQIQFFFVRPVCVYTFCSLHSAYPMHTVISRSVGHLIQTVTNNEQIEALFRPSTAKKKQPQNIRMRTLNSLSICVATRHTHTSIGWAHHESCQNIRFAMSGSFASMCTAHSFWQTLCLIFPASYVYNIGTVSTLAAIYESVARI